jgi:uncharacterized protein YwqG
MRKLPDDVVDEIGEMIAGSLVEPHLDALLPAVRPAMSIRVDDEADEPRIGGTHLRGAPDVPPGWQWPLRNGTPLALLAQFDCADFEPVDYFDQLPRAGVLAFFYDLQERAWGDEPDAKSAAIVQYFPDTSILRPADGGEQAEAFGMKLFQTWSLPSPGTRWFDRRFADVDEDEQFTNYGRYLSDVVAEEVIPITGHRLLGYPRREQSGDLELECELRQRGLKGIDRANPAFDEMDRAADDWILLAQFEYGDQRLTGEEHGDGLIYYFIRQQDLRERDFSRTQFFFEVS